MIIRELKNEELRMAVGLNYQCWNDDYAGIIPHDSMNIEEELAFVSDWLSDKECDDIRRIYGAFEGDNFLGFVGGSFTEKEDAENGVEINYLFVKKEYRGKALGLKLMRTILIEFKEYGVDQLIIYNFHDSESNKFYRYLEGEVVNQVIQTAKGKEALIDVFSWNINILIKLLNNKLYARNAEAGGFAFNETLSEDICMTTNCTEQDENIVCKGLLQHNVKKTYGLLKKPGMGVNLYLKENDRPIGAILCDTYNLCLYIDVMWIDEAYRGKGFGKKLISQAEKIAKDNGCVFSHTCTFSYQSPEFYKACGYKVFAELDDYPNDIVQYFLKKKL